MHAQSARIVHLLVVTTAILLGGCTFFAASGGGPVPQSQLGDWAGIGGDAQVAPESFAPAVEMLQRMSVSGSWEAEGSTDSWSYVFPTRGMSYKSRFNTHPGGPGKWHKDTLIFRQGGEGRRYYVSFNGYGPGFVIGHLLYHYHEADAYDVSTGKRVAAERLNIVLSPLGYLRFRNVLPMNSAGEKDLNAAHDASPDGEEPRYEVKDGTVLFGGILGWGRVNNTKYIQLLWIPIPIGNVAPPRERR